MKVEIEMTAEVFAVFEQVAKYNRTTVGDIAQKALTRLVREQGFYERLAQAGREVVKRKPVEIPGAAPVDNDIMARPPFWAGR